MSSSLEWNPVFPMVPLILAALIALGALLVVESRRRQRFMVARMACQIIIVLSVSCLIARPSMEIRSSTGAVALLTDGYNKSITDSLAAAVPGLTIMTTADAEPYPGATPIASDRDAASLTGSPMWVIGNGLPASSVPYVNSFEFLPAPLPEGIIELNLPRKIVEQVPNHINGVYHSRAEGRRKIRLLGPGGIEDSTSIERMGQTSFVLRLTSPAAGKILYRVEEADSAGKILSTSRLPVFVQAQTKLEILIVSDYPTFELRYLKNILADKGYKVSMRNRVSKNRFHQEFSNRPSQNLTNLTKSTLESTDLLILDQASYAALTGPEKKQILQSLGNGLGVLFMPTTATAPNHDLITLTSMPGTADTVRIETNGVRSTFPALALQPKGEVTPVTTTDQGRIVSGCLCTGERKVGFQLLRETYQLGLQGKSSAYAALWTPLLGQVARDRATAFNISLEQNFPVFTDEPNRVSLISSGADPTVTYDGVKLPLVEDVYVDELWHATVWAGGNRWHTLQADSTQLNFFDLPRSEWKTLQLANKIRANTNHNGVKQDESAVSERRTWTIFFFMLFIIASGFLWLTPKI